MSPFPDAVPRWAALAGAAAVLGSLVAGIAAVLLVGAVAAAADARETGLAAVVAVSLLTAAGSLWLLLRLAALTRPPAAAQFGLVMPPSPGAAVVRLALAALVLAAIGAAWSAAGWAGPGPVPPELDPRSALARSFDLPVRDGVGLDAAFVVSALARVAIPVVVAEILLRGFVFPALSGWKGPWVAGAVVAVLFGGAAGAAASAGLLVPGIVLGALLCALYVGTGSLLPGIALSAAASGALFGAACDLSAGAVALTAALCAAGAIGLVLPVLRPGGLAPVQRAPRSA